MAISLSEATLGLLDGPNYAVLATLSPGMGYHQASAHDARRRIVTFFDAHLRA